MWSSKTHNITVKHYYMVSKQVILARGITKIELNQGPTDPGGLSACHLSSGDLFPHSSGLFHSLTLFAVIFLLFRCIYQQPLSELRQPFQQVTPPHHPLIYTMVVKVTSLELQHSCTHLLRTKQHFHAPLFQHVWSAFRLGFRWQGCPPWLTLTL